MKVLNVSSDDYANFAHDNANALRSIGVECVDLKTCPHIFKYQSQSTVVTRESIIEQAKSADIIQIFHSDESTLRMVQGLGKKIVVYHTGTRYRLTPQRYNSIFNPHVYKSIIALCEFSGKGAKNEEYIVGAINVGSFIKKEIHQGSIVIGHYPSNSKIKGTDKIISMLGSIEKNFVFNMSTTHVPYNDQINRIKECDIYIELFKPTQNGRQYGSWGITAMEAAAAGKIVITQNLNNHVYLSAYKECALMLCNTEDKFLKTVSSLLSMDKESLYQLQQKTYNWVLKKHSYKATGLKILNAIR